MPKAVITRAKDRGDSIVEVDGVRVGTACRNPAAMGCPAWWTFWIDEQYRGKKEFVRAPSASGVREHAVAVFLKHAAKAA